jgi:hypothetical protein
MSGHFEIVRKWGVISVDAGTGRRQRYRARSTTSIAAAATASAAAIEPRSRRTKEEFFARLPGEADEDDELTKASNAAVDLVQAGKYEEAAWDLITRYPKCRTAGIDSA